MLKIDSLFRQPCYQRIVTLVWTTCFCAIGLLSASEAQVFKISGAAQEVSLRGQGKAFELGLYREVTWEEAILDQGTHPLCCSHAIVAALGYNHQRMDLVPDFLHKAVQGNYAQGMSLTEGVKFATTHGVIALPRHQKVRKRSGLPFPTTRRYAFAALVDLDAPLMQKAWGTSKVARYKKALSEFDYPIILSVHAGYKSADLENAPFSRYAINVVSNERKLLLRLQKRYQIPAHEVDGLEEEKESTYHAVLAYGFDQDCFLIKNSWLALNNSLNCPEKQTRGTFAPLALR